MWALSHLAFIQDDELRYTWVFSPEPGFDEQEILGKRDHDLFDRLVANRLDMLKRKALGEGALKAELDLDPEGRQVAEILLAPRPDGGLSGSMIDVSERVHQRQKAIGPLRDLRSILDSGDITFALLDANRRVRVASAGAKNKVREVYGLEMEAGLPFDVLVPKKSMALILERFPLVLEGQPFDLETSYTAPDGEPRSFVHNFTPVKQTIGGINGVLLMTRETTAQRRAEAAQRESERLLRHAQRLESLGLLAAGVAHDFNNLLVSVLGNAESVLDDPTLPQPLTEPLTDIKTAAQRAADLTHQLLAYAGKSKPAIGRLDLNEMVNEMTQLLRVNLPKGARFHLDLAGALPAIEADRAQVQQIVMNLVSNAAEAIAADGTVRLATNTARLDAPPADAIYRAPWVGGEYVNLEVSDTGSGMTAEVQARMFDPFFTTKFTGRGLGLASALGIVHSHQGAVRVNSAPGVGTTINVLLPISQRLPELAPPPIVASARGGDKILVVDDDPGVRKALARQLRRLGYECETTDDGSAALARLEDLSTEPRLMILDRTMPGMSGEEVLVEVRSRFPRVKVLMMSGFVGPSHQAGTPQPDAFLHKPFTTEDLDVELKRLLNEDVDGPRADHPPKEPAKG